ncbi:MAG: DUF5916 domain-containing protein [bacterium]
MIRSAGILLVSSIATALWAGDDAKAQRVTLQIPRVSQAPKLEDFLSGGNGKSQNFSNGNSHGSSNGNSHAPGNGNSSNHKSQAEITGFRQYEPGDGTPVSEETRAYLSYDEKNLFVVFVCKDDPDKLRARMAKREDISSDDQVVVYLDTFRDGQRAYIFAANPLGVQLDGVLTEGQDPDFSFDTLWRSEGRLTPDGFVVRMAIPFKSIRFSVDSTQSWGIALSRILPRHNEEAYWPYVTKRIKGLIPQFAITQGIQQISPGRNLQFIPYGIFSSARVLETETEAPGFNIANDRRLGVDAKAVLRDAFTLDMTLNPDFSQVESDEPQVTINQRFEVFFPEKRPFFIENAGFFQTPVNLFFSRRIVDPQYGARLTGKAGRWAVGALAIDDPAAVRLAEESDLSLDGRAGIGVLRLQREFGEQSNIGVLATSRDFASSSNRVFALDTRLKLHSNWILSAQAGRSITQEFEGPKLSGSTYFVELAHDSRNLEYFGRYLDFSPDFRSQLGFVPRVDIRQTEQNAKYRWRPKSGPIVKFGPEVLALLNWNRQGQMQDWQVDSEFQFELNGQTEIKVARTEAFELFENREFRKHATTIGVSSEWLKWLSFTAEYSWGTDVNFDPAPGMEPFLGKAREAKFQLTLRPTPRFRFEQTCIYGSLKTSINPRLGEAFAAASSVFNNPIARWKLTYQFTRELSVRAILDYEAVLPNPALVDLEREKRFAADILFTYMLNPNTALYVGYIDGYENLALTAAEQSELYRTNSPFNSTGRQFFLKASYLWRF